jgi:predicted ATP-binding protein involved in virulence
MRASRVSRPSNSSQSSWILAPTDRKEFELNQLSDGERGLLALAFDLTRRLAIANPKLKDPVAKSPAIVLLDEVELHLHPIWQRDVLRRLAKTFSNCQFIVTTHSPQVLGEVEGNHIHYLKRNKKGEITRWTPPRALGLDSNRVLRELMDAPSRNAVFDAQAHKLFQLIDAERFRDAKTLMSKIEGKLGEDEPDVVRARALMAFLKGKK